MIFIIPLCAVVIGFALILLIKQSSPAVEYERMGHEEKLDPEDQAMTMSEEAFRIFIIDLYAERGFEPVKLYEESEGVFVMIMENQQPVFGGKQVLKCIRSLESGHVSSKEIPRFREIVRGEAGGRGVILSALPFTHEAKEVARDLGIELVGPSRLRAIVDTGRTSPATPGATDPAILPSNRPWSPDGESVP